MKVFVTSVLFMVVLVIPLELRAALQPPLRVIVSDSVSTTFDKGVELNRYAQYLGWNAAKKQTFDVRGFVHWRTDYRFVDREQDRIRQDGRWYVGGLRKANGLFDFWVGAEGEHFDDRPVRTPSPPPMSAGLNPRSVELESDVLSPVASQANSVRILRGGAGTVFQPDPRLAVDIAGGGVEDRRIGKREAGLGLWSALRVEDWETSGYLHDAGLEYNRETPRNHANSDAIGRYRVFREFSPGNSNLAEASGSVLHRDIYLDASATVSQRVEEHLEIRDVIAYQTARNVSLQLTGEILHEQTTQTQVDEWRSALEENQAAFLSRVNAKSGDWNGDAGFNVRQITQTIRGDVLQGLKSDLYLAGSAPAPWRSRLSARFSVSKYALDTRSEQNFDDRDELRYAIEATWRKPLLETLIYEAYGIARLDHLVYVFAQNSANNRWTRYFVAGTRMRHRPRANFEQLAKFSVSANYSDYDFEFNPRSARSTVYRRLTLADSIGARITPVLSAKLTAQGQTEEFGRLFWSSFEEERSDETRSLTAAAEFGYRVHRSTETGAGYLWDSRLSERFPENENDLAEIYQKVWSYGPTWFAHIRYRRMELRITGRAIRQLQLEKDDRWLLTGEALLAWRF